MASTPDWTQPLPTMASTPDWMRPPPTHKDKPVSMPIRSFHVHVDSDGRLVDSEPEHEVVEMDCEPDDFAAVVAHAWRCERRGRRVRLTLVVGEGDARVKVVLVRRFMKLVVAAFPRAYVGPVDIIEGESSETPYPVSRLQYILSQCDAPQQHHTPREVIWARYKELYSDPRIKTVYMLKPPREALRLHREIADLKRITVHAYTGFNWRVTNAKLRDLVHLVGSYGRFNAATRFEALGPAQHTLYQIKRSPSTDLGREIRAYVFNWNMHLVELAGKTLRDEPGGLGVVHNKVDDAKAQARAIVESINGHELDQFVMADVVCVLCKQPTEHSELSAVAGEQDTSFHYDDAPHEQERRRARLVADLDELFERL